MILKNKKLLIITSLLILLPIPVGMLLKTRFPAEFLEEFWYTLYLPPLSLLAGHWLCILMTNLDPGHKERNRKPLNMVLWIMPVISNLVCGIMYAFMLGVKFSPVGWMFGAMGAMFAVIGNYMPKTKMNYTLGIKVSWTYSSEANWNATHRFAGKVWVIGGIAMMLCAFLPEKIAAVLMLAEIAVLVVLPVWYSWRFYKKEKAEGKAEKITIPPINKKITKWSAVFLAALMVFVLAIMFVGDLEYSFEEEAIMIEADWYSDLTLRYDQIESLEYRDGNVPGIRVGGFGSARLLMGWFTNEEFGTYTRYTYTKPDGCIIVTTQSRTLVLSAQSGEETLRLYQQLQERSE